MKMRMILGVLVIAAVVMMPFTEAMAGSNSSSDILKSGLLGAGAGLAGGAASGGKGKDLWKGALAGAGVNVVGGALLDSMSGEKVQDTQYVDQQSPRNAYQDGYQDGYNNGYKRGYTEGYKEGLKD